MAQDREDQANVERAVRDEVVSAGRHSLVYVVGQALSRLVGFVMIPVYTRFIPPTNYGAMELIHILIGAMTILIAMGVTESMSRFYYAESSEGARRKIVSTIVVGFGLLSLPFIGLLLLASNLFSHVILPEPLYQVCLRIAIACVWFAMLNEIGLSYLRMRYMAKFFVFVTTTQLILALGLNIWFIVYLKMGILGMFWSNLISLVVVSTIMTVAILKNVGMAVIPPILWRVVAFGLPLVPWRLGLMLGFVSNRFFLRWLGSPDPAVALALVGILSLGHKFAVIINRFVTVPFNAFWGPRRLELVLQDRPAARETVARMCTYSMLLTIYLGLMLSAGIESVIEVIADDRYQGAHVVVPYIVLAYVVLGLENHFVTGILCKNKTRYATYISLLGIAVVILWNIAFVPVYGIIGAATSNLAGFAVRITLTYLISQRLYPIPFELTRVTKMFVAAFGVYALSQLVRIDSPYPNFVLRTAIVACYPLTLFLVRFYRPEEIAFARRALKKLWGIVRPIREKS